MPISPAAALPAPVVHRPESSRGFGLSPQVIGLFLALSLVGVLTVNPLLTVASIAIFPLLVALTWVPGEPPVLSFVLGFHWLQATTRVFHANLVGVDVQDLVLYPRSGAFADVEGATWLTLAGLVALAVGMRMAVRNLEPPNEESLAREASTFSLSRVFWLYFAVTFVVTAAAGSVGALSGFRQILLAAEQIKWGVYFLLGYLVFARRDGYLYLGIAFAIEFISGIGFFSGFKEVIFVTIITYFAARSRITMGTVVKGLVVVIALGTMGSAWTVVKPEYRKAISGRSGTQQVVVDQGDQVSILTDLLSDVDREALGEGLEPLAERLSYVDFFGYALGYVPDVTPHEGGVLWWTAVKHVATPRILFPNKPSIVSDSDVTNRYTGLGVAGSDEGTSFSIGYIGESYIDFGPFWMFVPILLIGLGRGLMYRYFLARGSSQLAGYAFAVALFMSLYQLEKATGKLLGGFLMKFIVLALLFRFFSPIIVRWLRREEAEQEEDEGASLPLRQVWA